jgi:hypothetical protein
MPKISDSALLQRALVPAINDRLGLADAYGNTGAVADEALALIKALRRLKGVALAKMTPAQLATASSAFIFAEQWEASLADALPKGAERNEAFANAERFRLACTRIWGKTEYEVFFETATPVEVMPVNRFHVDPGVREACKPVKLPKPGEENA